MIWWGNLYFFVYIGSINNTELGLDILLKSENRKKEIYSFQHCLSIFKATCFCLFCTGVNEAAWG